MPRYIIKIDEYYLEWSTVVDAPTTYGMPLDEFRDFYRDEYGKSGMGELDQRLKRVEDFGTSSIIVSLEDLLEHNRAGPDETSIGRQEILETYCINRPNENEGDKSSLELLFECMDGTLRE